MQIAAIPHTEDRRLKALQQYQILDTLPEVEYDRITKLASIICGTPIALVSLIDKDRQWFKSKVGIDATETPRELAFCAHAILTPEKIFVVPDTHNDTRFSDSPIVLGDPKIRFYADVPLQVSSGDAVGTLCVVDTVPKKLTPQQIEALSLLAQQVVSAIELRNQVNTLEAFSKEQTYKLQSQLLRNISVDAAAAGSIEILIEIVLRSICEFLKWPIGHAFMWNEEAGLLRSSKIWYLADSKYRSSEFVRITEALEVKSGIGLVGSVVARKGPVYMKDASVDTNFLRAEPLAAIHLRTAMAFPVFINGRVVSVLEFFSADTIDEESLSYFIETISMQLGSVVERMLTEKKLKEITEIYRLIVESSPDLIFVKDSHFRFVQANQALLSAFPKEVRDSILGTTALEKFTKEEAEGYLENDRKAFKEGYSETVENATFENGKTITLFTKKVRFTNTKGEAFILGVARDITSFKKAEAALRQSNLLNNAILSSAAHMIIATDFEGKVIVFNSEAERLLGYKAEEVLHKKTPALWHKQEEIVAKAKQLSKEFGRPVAADLGVFHSKVLAQGSEESEWTFVRKDGTSFSGLLITTALKDSQQKVVGFLGIIQDVTERNRMLKELRVSQERLFLASSGTSDGLWDWDITTGNSHFSPRFEQMMGYGPGEMKMTLEQFRQRIHPDDQEHTKLAVQNHFIKRIPHDVEYRVLNKQGNYIWLNARGQASWDEQDTPVRMTGFVTDITARKEAEERERQLKREATKLLAVFDKAPDYIGMADLEGNLQYHNRTARQMIGLPENADLSHLKIADMHPAWAVKHIMENAMPTLYERGVWRGETAILHRDGHEIPVAQMLMLYRDEKGVPICLATIMQDITERRQFDATRQKLMEKLSDSNTQLERFAYVASHDMQEPLRMIANFSGLIVEEYAEKLDEAGKEYITLVKDSALRMQNMVADLLDYARVKNDENRFTHVDGEMELKHVLNNLSSAIADHEATVTHDVLPQFTGNPVQFMRLMQNLIGNGMKYQREGNAPKVHIAVKDAGDYWQFSVSDNGIGINEEFVKEVFEPFKRLHTWEEYKGSGIGLAVCKQIVESHGGKIWATSEPGKGSTFHFTIEKNDKHGMNKGQAA